MCEKKEKCTKETALWPLWRCCECADCIAEKYARLKENVRFASSVFNKSKEKPSEITITLFKRAAEKGKFLFASKEDVKKIEDAERDGIKINYAVAIDGNFIDGDNVVTVDGGQISTQEIKDILDDEIDCEKKSEVRDLKYFIDKNDKLEADVARVGKIIKKTNEVLIEQCAGNAYFLANYLRQEVAMLIKIHERFAMILFIDRDLIDEKKITELSELTCERLDELAIVIENKIKSIKELRANLSNLHYTFATDTINKVNESMKEFLTQ